MRVMLFALVVVLGLPAASVAQQPRRDSVPLWSVSPLLGPSAAGWPRNPPPSWSVSSRKGPVPDGLPLPPIGAPLPTVGLQPRPERPEPLIRRRERTASAWPVIIVVPQFAAPIAQAAPVAPAAPREERPSTGSLLLQVVPGSAQVFADGYYVGTADDLGAASGGLILEPGPHAITVTAAGYEPVSINTMISSERTIAYRAELIPIETARPVPPPHIRPSTFFLIPGCYAGNVPPEDAGLPSTCDLSQAVRFDP